MHTCMTCHYSIVVQHHAHITKGTIVNSLHILISLCLFQNTTEENISDAKYWLLHNQSCLPTRRRACQKRDDSGPVGPSPAGQVKEARTHRGEHGKSGRTASPVGPLQEERVKGPKQRGSPLERRLLRCTQDLYLWRPGSRLSRRAQPPTPSSNLPQHPAASGTPPLSGGTISVQKHHTH